MLNNITIIVENHSCQHVFGEDSLEIMSKWLIQIKEILLDLIENGDMEIE